MSNETAILYAFLGGLLPALVWLWFWLREDRRNPEPHKFIFFTFVLGMIAVLVVLPFQKTIDIALPGMGLAAITLWVAGEEILKIAAAYAGGMRSRAYNEPLDSLVYMITAALGFVALENTLFIFNSLGIDSVAGLATGNMRFIGASLLHVVSSGIVGTALAFTFYKPGFKRLFYFLIALTLAIGFHTGFNILIIYWDSLGTAVAFISVWVSVIALLLTFEKIKTIASPKKDVIIE